MSAAINFAFVILMIIKVCSNSTHSVVDHFCQQSNNITNAFIIGHNIYLGSDDNYFWVYSLKMNTIINRVMSDDIFPQYPFENIKTAVMFDFDPCVSYFGDQHCNTAVNAKNLVMVFSHNDSDYLYTSYRLHDNGVTLTPIESDSDMPWSLSRNGSVDSNQIFKSYSTSLKLFGLTFTTVGGQHYLLSSVISVSNRYYGEMSSKSINSSTGSFDPSDWFLEKVGVYYGLFDVNGVVFGLIDDQIFERIEWNDDFVGVENYTEKELFNCYQNSSLVTNTTETETTTITTQQISNYSAYTPAINDTTDSGNGSKKKSSYTPKKPMTGKLAILMLALLVVMAIVLAFIYFRTCRNRIRTEDEVSKSEREADSLVKSEVNSAVKSEKLETKSLESVETNQNAENSDKNVKKSRESLTQ